MLTSHVRAMAHQVNQRRNRYRKVDASLFERKFLKIQMMLAREVVAQFGKLPDEEAWLLSVHFESRKKKNL